MLRFRQRWRGLVSFIGIGIKTSARQPDSETAVIVMMDLGAASPTRTDLPQGSVILNRTAGAGHATQFYYTGAAWIATVLLP